MSCELVIQTTIAMDKNNEKSDFGWKSLFRYYGLKGFLRDITLPIIISIAICVGTYLSSKDSLDILKTVTGLANEIVPAMIGLVLAAYTVLLTFFTGNSFKKATETDDGRKFIKGINAGFAACLSLLAISVVFSIIIAVCIEWGYTSEIAEYINIGTLFGVSFLLSYAIISIFGIIIDIYNSGQTTVIQ